MTVTRKQAKNSGWMNRDNEETKAYVLRLVNEVEALKVELEEKICLVAKVEAEHKDLKSRIERLENSQKEHESQTECHCRTAKPANNIEPIQVEDQTADPPKKTEVNQTTIKERNSTACKNRKESTAETGGVETNVTNDITAIQREINEIQLREKRRDEELMLFKESVSKMKEKPVAAWKEIVREDPDVKKVMIDVIEKNLDVDFRDSMVVKALPMVRQEMDRFRSVIVVGIKEDSNKTSYERNEDDNLFVRNMLGALQMGWAEREIVTKFRIGKFRNYRSRPRLLKITFSREDTQKQLLAKAKHLRHTSAFNKVFIRRDKTARERQFRRETTKVAEIDRVDSNKVVEPFLGTAEGGLVRQT